jgi:hypothetical protein
MALSDATWADLEPIRRAMARRREEMGEDGWAQFLVGHRERAERAAELRRRFEAAFAAHRERGGS